MPWLGPFIDRMPLYVYSLFSCLVMSSGFLILSWARDIWLLGLGLGFLRLGGQSLLVHVAGVSVSRYFTEGRGKALALSSVGYSLGEAIIPIVLVKLMGSTHDWRHAASTLAGFSFLVFIPIHRLLIGKNNPFSYPVMLPMDAKRNQRSLGKYIFSSRQFWLLLPSHLTPALLWTGLFYIQTDIGQIKHWNLVVLASSFSTYALMRIVSTFFVGHLIDRFTALRLAPYMTIPAIFSLLALYFAKGPSAAFWYMGLLGTGIGFTATIMTAVWTEVYGSHWIASVRSILSPISIFATALSPIICGYSLGFGYGLLPLVCLYVALMLFSILLSIKAKEKKPSSQKNGFLLKNLARRPKRDI